MFFGDGALTAEFWGAFRNTFLLSFSGLCFGFPMPIIIALFFNEIRSNVARSIYQVLTYLPKFMSTVVMTSLVTMLVRQASPLAGMEMGVVSRLLVNLGFISAEVGNAGLLNAPEFFRGIYQISGIWETAGYDSIIFFSAIIAISLTSYEAAQIDGCGHFGIYFRIMFPQAKPIFGALFLTTWLASWNNYESALLYLPNLPTLPVGIYQFNTEMIFRARLDILFAACVLVSLPALILFTAFNKVITTNVSLGGIKG